MALNFQYTFTNKRDQEILSVISKEPINLKGWQMLAQEYPDSTVTDRFYIIDDIKSDMDSEGQHYKWYTINNHYREIDKTKKLFEFQEQMDELCVDQEYRLTLLELETPINV